ncbi:MAG TPA: hypothetical protein VII58_13395 [Acidobacteriaceae bacterium]
MVTAIDLAIDVPSVEFRSSMLAMAAFGIVFFAAGAAVVMQVTLWLGMIWLTLVGNQPLLYKFLAITLQMMFLSLGSAIVYLIFYRSELRQLNKANVSDVLSI